MLKAGGRLNQSLTRTVILLHPPLPLVGVSIVMERERQQNDSLVNGYHSPPPERQCPCPCTGAAPAPTP